MEHETLGTTIITVPQATCNMQDPRTHRVMPEHVPFIMENRHAERQNGLLYLGAGPTALGHRRILR